MSQMVRYFATRGLLACGLLLGSVPLVSAQSVIDPTILQFDPSPDHQLLTRYDLEFYVPGQLAPFQTVPLGKPAIGADGKVTVLVNGILPPYPTRGVDYTASIASVAPGGTSRSTPSNTFQFSTCGYQVSSTSTTMPRDAGTATIAILAPDGCAWASSSATSWLTVNSGSGAGTGLLTFSVAANTTGSPRTAVLTVAGQTVSVTQSITGQAAVPSAPANVRIVIR